MKNDEINKALLEIVELKNQLIALDYSDAKYDDLEEELHDAEDDFTEAYGDMLEKALKEVHEKYCPDSDILLPIAYLAKKYTKGEKGGYMISKTDGVPVDCDNYPAGTRLLMLPDPVRLILNISGDKHEEVWRLAE